MVAATDRVTGKPPATAGEGAWGVHSAMSRRRATRCQPTERDLNEQIKEETQEGAEEEAA